MSIKEALSVTELPAVAKSFFAFCTKCDADRYHKVVAHTTPTTAKLKCEVCGASKKYTLPKTQERKSNSSAVARRAATARLAKPKVISETARQSAHKSSYESLMSQESPEKVYNMKTKFDKNIKLSHPKFGIGFVTEAFSDKIDVVFVDEVRSLIHNRN
ncbi:MAG TPA: hypothetical protein PLJ21_08950 [Pseudobdellovibrionaceae bacterium]|nr:hypothetical protein [Pseudobdellovibrionaceae bacterium]